MFIESWLLVIFFIAFALLIVDNFRKYQHVTQLKHNLGLARASKETYKARILLAKNIARQSADDLWVNGRGSETVDRVETNLHRIKNI